MHEKSKLDTQGYSTGDRWSRVGGHTTVQNAMLEGTEACKITSWDAHNCDDE